MWTCIEIFENSEKLSNRVKNNRVHSSARKMSKHDHNRCFQHEILCNFALSSKMMQNFSRRVLRASPMKIGRIRWHSKSRSKVSHLLFLRVTGKMFAHEAVVTMRNEKPPLSSMVLSLSFPSLLLQKFLLPLILCDVSSVSCQKYWRLKLNSLHVSLYAVGG